MKLLHISDLHIGKIVHDFSMIEEQKYAFSQILSHARAEKPDAILIAGDVFDRPVPSAEAIGIFDDFLTVLAGLDVTVMLISGNHDSPERINFASRLLTDLSSGRIFLCGGFDGDIKKVMLADKYGYVNFWLLPFIKPSSIRALLKHGGADDSPEIETYEDAFRAVLAKENINFAERNVLVAHQFFTKPGVTPVQSDSELNPVGGLDAIDIGLIRNFDFVALGHLHGRQSVGESHICYSGSPVKYSFSEWRHKKSVSKIILGKKNDVSTEFLPLTPLRDMREIKGRLEDLLHEDIVAEAGANNYIRAILTDEVEPYDCMARLRAAYPNIMNLHFDNRDINTAAIYADISEIEKISPLTIFSNFFLESQGFAMTEEQMKIVRDLLERTDEE